ncbi:protein kinase domain-containing protein [Maridesulfovibrio sp.]|uniref:protein kinase domain-containing protein n=1 Tax=Maridesulfovibrio sp. TaxID=2795000 RepID=UPI002AA7260F|nr:protein kinase [Maridesulfovibrio sp.]
MYKVGDTVLGKYIIDEALDMGGGMADIYFGHNKDLGFKVVIKRLKKNFVENKSVREKFKIEAVTQSNIDHPGIVKVIDFDSDNYCMVMEYVQGKEMSDCMDAPMQQKVDMFIQAFKALQAAHEIGVVHRDIKPANMFVTNKGQVKVADFGIAKLIGEENSEMTTMGVGTASYMSPEQIRGEMVNESSDIYSMGVVMYYLLTGKRPFKGNTPQLTAMMHINDQPPTFEEMGSTDIPPQLEQVVQKCLNKNPKDRYENCTAVATELKEILESWDSPAASSKKGGQGISKGLIAGIAVIIVGIAAAAFFFISKGQEPTPPAKPKTAQIEIDSPAKQAEPEPAPKKVQPEPQHEAVTETPVVTQQEQDREEIKTEVKSDAPEIPFRLTPMPPALKSESRYFVVEVEGKAPSSETMVEAHEKALLEARRNGLQQARRFAQLHYGTKAAHNWYNLIFPDNINEIELMDIKQGQKKLNGEYIIKGKASVPFKAVFSSDKTERYEYSSKDGLLMNRLWTDRSSYPKGAHINVIMQGNKDYYCLVAFVASTGEIIRLLPNSNRTEKIFKAGTMYRIPNSEDAFSLEVAPPYGTERIVLFSSTVPLGNVELQNVGDSLSLFSGTLNEFRHKLMDLKISPENSAEFFEGTWEVTTGP